MRWMPSKNVVRDLTSIWKENQSMYQSNEWATQSAKISRNSLF